MAATAARAAAAPSVTERVNIAFVGAGKVGCSLARFLGSGERASLAGFFSRSATSAREAAAFAGGVAFASLGELAAAADVVFVTTPDAEIEGVAEELARANLAGKVVAHCSGATGSCALDACRAAGASVTSCHPLYAVSNRFESWAELVRCWFTLEGDDIACEVLEGLLAGLGCHVARIDAASKTRYHAAAVMASNLVVGLYDMAAGELESCGFSHEDAQAALGPLFLGNAEHVATAGAEAALTGPAARGDEETIARHLARLGGSEREVYELLTQRCREIAARRPH